MTRRIRNFPPRLLLSWPSAGGICRRLNCFVIKSKVSDPDEIVAGNSLQIGLGDQCFATNRRQLDDDVFAFKTRKYWYGVHEP